MKRKMPPHIVLPNGQWRFVKRSKAKRKVVEMARYRRTRRAARYVSGGVRSRYKSSGGWKSMIAPVAGGALDSILDPKLPINGLGGAGVGFILKDQTTMKIGLYKVGYSLPQMLGISGLLGGSNGGNGNEGVL